jgi:ribose 5-phosphate isomerase B
MPEINSTVTQQVAQAASTLQQQRSGHAPAVVRVVFSGDMLGQVAAERMPSRLPPHLKENMSDLPTHVPTAPKRIGIAADHGGYELKQYLVTALRAAGHEVRDFGDRQPTVDDDYPDFVVPLARAVASGEVDRGVAICGSGVGASVVANKVVGVRACLIHEIFSAHQGVEDDDLNMICLGGLVVGHALAWDLVQSFLAARFSGAERHRRRLAKVAALESRSASK